MLVYLGMKVWAPMNVGGVSQEEGSGGESGDEKSRSNEMTYLVLWDLWW